MKKLILVLTGLIAVVVINAQSLEEIVKRYSAANKQDRITGLKTLKITGNMSMMGMEMPMVMWMKNPNKIKTVTSMSGKDIISVFDGEKGYQIDPKQIDKLQAGKAAQVFATIKAHKKAIPGDYVTIIDAKTPEVSSKVSFRISVETPMLWGWIGVLIIIVALGGVYYLFRKYGRR